MTTTEEAAGIVCYTTDTPPFSAILKHRFTDFLVNEIDANGNLVRLTDLEASTSTNAHLSTHPQPAKPSEAEKKESEPLQHESAAAPESTPAAAEHSSAPAPRQGWSAAAEGFAGILPADSHAAVTGFYEAIAAFEAARTHGLPKQEDGSERDYVRPPKPLRVPVSADKATRTRVHELCRDPRLPKVSTQTILDDPEHPTMELTFSYKRNKRRRGENGQAGEHNADSGGWPADSAAKFCRFVLYKENIDSAHALGLMARLLRVSQSTLSVAGTKDKRAVTVQHVTAFKVPPRRLTSLNKCMRGARVGNFELVQEQLHLGDALGNRFEITLRDVVAPSLQAVADAAEALKARGFVNYFGLQRFGAGVNATHHVGRELIRGNWKGAVQLIMAGHEGEREDSAQARKLFLESDDVAGALKQMPRHQTVERAILEGLRKQPGNHAHALHQVPRNSRHLYVHAYQSYLWNAAASHRVRAHGIEAAVAGDLVIPSEEKDAEAVAETSDKRTTGHLAAVHIVTEEEAATGAFAIDDVVLPLPGSCITYPQHSTAEVYTASAAKDGISLETAPHGDKNFSLLGMPGGYRRVLHRPADMQWRLLSYKGADEDLAITDLQRMEHASLPSVTPITPDAELEEGTRVALQLAFKLPGACYATMLVRELTKTSTATAVHKKLTQQLPNNGVKDS